MKPKTCKNPSCKAKFAPKRPLQQVCSVTCASALAAIQREKERERAIKQDRAITKAKKQSLKTRSQWMKEAQVEFNRYIRLRDQGRLCICCDRPLSSGDIGGSYDCGHYRSVGSAPHLRFDERNAHAQRKQCNRWGSGRAVDYRLGLIKRIGIEAVEALEADQTMKHYAIDDLKQLKALYRAKARELEKQFTSSQP